jgi:hypothetical protein
MNEQATSITTSCFTLGRRVFVLFSFFVLFFSFFFFLLYTTGLGARGVIGCYAATQQRLVCGIYERITQHR